MKNQTLRIIAYCLGILAWIMLVIGIGFTIIIGMAAATAIARIAFVLGGLVMTAIIATSLLACSKLIYLFINIGDNLGEIKTTIKEKKL
jgi:hypothetical protein